ncbi:MAG: VOC family protein [Bauldia sp.]|nr:VOC family protein [Bauldia sp.]
MDTDALALARRLAAENLTERLTWGAIALSVTDLDRAARFWTSVLGFVPRHGGEPGLALGTPERTLVVLHPGAETGVAKGHAGMYHVAFGMPSQAEFSRMMARLLHMGIPHSPVDHLMSKAIYLADPDGHGIEIAYETPERFSRFSNDGGRFALIDAGGQVRSGRDRLDVRAELSLANGTDPGEPLHRDAVLAHLHLHVPDLPAALDWFEGIGFARNLILADFGMADMGAGAPYTHRLAVNIWAGQGVTPAPATSARLLAYGLDTRDAAVFATARSRFNEAIRPGELLGTDPAGVALRLRLRRSITQKEKAA